MIRCLALVLAAGLAASGCSSLDRLAHVGEQPPLKPITDPTAQPGYKPVSMPMPAPEPVAYAPNSLFRSGARGFFKDQRAHRVGDILTVKVTITDKAKFDNTTKRSRASKEDLNLGGIPGAVVNTWVTKDLDGKAQVGTTSSTENSGAGSIDRSETLETNVATVVTQILPNGNLVIEGRQEVRVNFEVRELIIGGIIRPEDVGADNTIESSKIAEARIAYGGRGQITDVQQPRLGNQVMDILLPF